MRKSHIYQLSKEKDWESALTFDLHHGPWAKSKSLCHPTPHKNLPLRPVPPHGNCRETSAVSLLFSQTPKFLSSPLLIIFFYLLLGSPGMAHLTETSQTCPGDPGDQDLTVGQKGT